MQNDPPANARLIRRGETPGVHHLSVPRTARYATLGPLDGAVREVWFACHGYGQLARDFLQPFRVLDDGTRLIVAPEALSRFYLPTAGGDRNDYRLVGASWMTRADRTAEIADYVHYLDSLYGRVFERRDRAHVTVHLLGFSQGAATAVRWLTQGSARFDRLILWAGLVPPDLDIERATQRLGSLRLVCVIGDTDELATEEAVAEQQERLQRLNIRAELITFKGGHRLSKAVLRKLAAS